MPCPLIYNGANGEMVTRQAANGANGERATRYKAAGTKLPACLRGIEWEK